AGKSALVVSPTHHEGEEVTAQIRETLRRDQRIGKEERTFMRQRNLAWTKAERADAGNYRPGLIVQFHQNAKGFRRGERVTVVGRDEQGRVIAQKPAGDYVALPLNLPERFCVYEASAVALARGDRLRITQNGFTADGKHRLNNGALFTVKGFT